MVKSNFDYEDIYAAKIMRFEKEMARKRLRPPLPARQGGEKKYDNMVPAAVTQRAEQAKTRAKVFRSVLLQMKEGEAANVPSLATRMGTTPQKLANYVRIMVDEGYLSKISMMGGKIMYVYMKTGKEVPAEMGGGVVVTPEELKGETE